MRVCVLVAPNRPKSTSPPAKLVLKSELHFIYTHTTTQCAFLICPPIRVRTHTHTQICVYMGVCATNMYDWVEYECGVVCDERVCVGVCGGV